MSKIFNLSFPKTGTTSIEDDVQKALGDKVLVMNLEDVGWDKLGKFLNCKIPRVDFPFVNTFKKDVTGYDID